MQEILKQALLIFVALRLSRLCDRIAELRHK